MKSLSDNDVARLAHLSQLSLTADEKERLKEDLTQVIQYIERIQKVQVQDVPRMAHVHDISLSLREDVPRQPCLGTSCISDSAGYSDGLVQVPAILPSKKS
ncbi:MAG: Asp-tRNA(Asn)/Glu-tRNA(Gln) amidotransferase subunit GatC [Myxococcota bacterium]